LCIFGDNDIDYKTALNMNVKFYGVDWGEFSYKNVVKVNYSNLIGVIFNGLVPEQEKVQDIEVVTSYVVENLMLHDENRYYLGYYKDPIKEKIFGFKNNKKKEVDEWNSIIEDNVSSLPKINYIVRALGHNETIIENTSLDSTGQLISEHTSAKYIPDLLIKNSATKKSTTMGAQERKEEIKGKYSINKMHQEYEDLQSENRTILIIDDVYTTGATMSEITRVLSNEFSFVKIYIFSLVQTKGFSDTPQMQHHNHNLFKMLEYSNSKIEKQPIEFKKNLYVVKSFSANYSFSNHNFIIQNLFNYSIKSDPRKSKYLPAIYILKNILQRGKPTLLSKYLQEHIGSIHKQSDFRKSYALIDKTPLPWKRIIRGDERNNYYPAKKFYDDLLPKYLGEYSFVKNLIIPEVSIYDITRVYVKELYNQQVDFYLPQASLIIEIDGTQHQASKTKDRERDLHTAKHGIETIRITTNELESEDQSFLFKIEQIKSRIKQMTDLGLSRQQDNATVITLDDYQNTYLNNPDLDNSNYIATAIMRMQLLILELLENDSLSFEDEWLFEIKEHDIHGFTELAIEDTFLWLHHILRLHGINFKKPFYKVTIIALKEDFSSSPGIIKVDFSLLQRFTDICQDSEGIIYVRTHYLDEYRYFRAGNAANIQESIYKEYDFFTMSTLEPISYSLNLDGNDSDKISLLFLLENIFLQNIDNVDFREGQLGIITNALSRNNTVGLLPTGSGKSICYQLASILQPAISFVVCPIKSLMYDQKADLDEIFFSRTNYITSDLNSEEKATIQREYAEGKYFFIFVSPERFQSKVFREEFASINQEKAFAYAVIDEVHCLSEWGHDFRTSYLNLSNAISKLSPEASYIGLTATASVDVLRDIQIEFNIEDMDVKTPLNYTREELKFNVINDYGSKENELQKQLLELDTRWKVFTPNGKDSRCGIIFTPHVNGDKGCYTLSKNLSNALNIDVGYYSGSVPKVNRQAVMKDKDFDIYKKSVQDGFKDNRFTLLTATKAFGMGVNKGNIFYTIHYGIPSSMESLYQEAGRAGRDKSKFIDESAECLVLLTPERNPEVLTSLWEPTITLDELKEASKHTLRDGDINTNLFMFTNSLDTINNEYSLMKDLYTQYYSSEVLKQLVKSSSLNSTKAKVEKAIYRLSQLGIVDDWTIEDFFRGEFSVEFKKHTEEDVLVFMTQTIQKYDKNFSLDNLKKEGSKHYNFIFSQEDRFAKIEIYFVVLLLWSYEHFAYKRRQSLKNVYDNCTDLASGKITDVDFKQTLENYFKFNESSYVLQHVADNPNDYTKWFEVFYKIVDGYIEDILINKPKQVQTKDQLSRFLESYMQNVGLNFISGILRLLLNDYNDPDGRVRFENSLTTIKDYETKDKDKIIDRLINLASFFEMNQKNLLVRSIDKIFNDRTLLYKFSATIEDEYSLGEILSGQVTRLQKINQKIKEIPWEIK
jgi:ATP-dependent DNA helicase RecQ